jgi:hypothetical protein
LEIRQLVISGEELSQKIPPPYAAATGNGSVLKKETRLSEMVQFLISGEESSHNMPPP